MLAVYLLGKERRRRRGTADRLPAEHKIAVHLGDTVGQGNRVDTGPTRQDDVMVGRFHPGQRHAHIQAHAERQRIEGSAFIALLRKLQRRDGVGVGHLAGGNSPAVVGIDLQRRGLLRNCRHHRSAGHIAGRQRGGKAQ